MAGCPRGRPRGTRRQGWSPGRHGRQVAWKERFGKHQAVTEDRSDPHRCAGMICIDDVSLHDHAGSIRNPDHGGSYHEHRCPLQSHALTAEKYAETIRQLTNAGEWPPAGLDYHVCFGADGNLKVSEIWNSREQFEAFGKRLMPILAGVGSVRQPAGDLRGSQQRQGLTFGRGGPIENRRPRWGRRITSPTTRLWNSGTERPDSGNTARRSVAAMFIYLPLRQGRRPFAATRTAWHVRVAVLATC